MMDTTTWACAVDAKSRSSASMTNDVIICLVSIYRFRVSSQCLQLCLRLQRGHAVCCVICGLLNGRTEQTHKQTIQLSVVTTLTTSEESILILVTAIHEVPKFLGWRFVQFHILSCQSCLLAFLTGLCLCNQVSITIICHPFFVGVRHHFFFVENLPSYRSTLTYNWSRKSLQTMWTFSHKDVHRVLSPPRIMVEWLNVSSLP